MGLPAAVIWGGVWAAGAIGARLAAREVIRRVLRAAARRAASRVAQQAYAAATAAGTLAPEDYTGIENDYAGADERADALAREMAAACAADPQKCEACAANRGSPGAPPRTMSARARLYQQFITGFPRGVEYQFSGVWFDGFWMPICTLVEAKDKYDQFLNVVIDENLIFADTIESVGFKDWFGGLPALIAEGTSHANVTRPHPAVMLQWHCAQIAFTIALTEEFAQRGVPIVPQYTPNPAHADPHGGFI